MIDRILLKGMKCCKGSNSSDPKPVVPQQHVKWYVNECCLTVSIGKLLCVACRGQLSLKCSVINYNVNSSKHSAGKARVKNKQRAEMELVEALKFYDAMENPRSVTLSNEQCIYMYSKIVQTVLLAGMLL